MKFIDKHGFILTLSNETELSVDEAAELINNGLMSIFWTQKVKLFYAALLANNSH
jgi:hypothetical protein